MKIINKITILSLVTAMTFTSCTDYEDLNTDPTKLSDVNPGTLLNPILYNVASWNWYWYDDFTFPLMQIEVSTSSTSDAGWYLLSDAAGDGKWKEYYRWLNNISEMRKEAVTYNVPNYDAIGLTLEAWIYELLAESFGDIPMNEACMASENNFAPKFDTQKDVFKLIIQKLDSANNEYDTKEGLKYNSNGELLYGTDASLTAGVSEGIMKWKKLNNSLRMRVLLRLLNVDGFDAKNKLAEMVSQSTVYPVFESNNDEAKVHITGISPLLPPLNRPQDFTAYVSMSTFFIDSLKAMKDPRIAVFASKATNNNIKDYYGIQSGYDVLPSTAGSSPNQTMAKAPLDLMVMPYCEVEFIKAELAYRGIIPESAEEHYNKAVNASMTQWGVTAPATYFTNAASAYNGTLDRIMEQKFISLLFVDFQQWFEYNRTGMPNVPIGPGVAAGNSMPKRFKYPAVLQRTNLNNYNDAVKNMGGKDDFYQKLIWQK